MSLLSFPFENTLKGSKNIPMQIKKSFVTWDKTWVVEELDLEKMKRQSRSDSLIIFFSLWIYKTTKLNVRLSLSCIFHFSNWIELCHDERWTFVAKRDLFTQWSIKANSCYIKKRRRGNIPNCQQHPCSYSSVRCHCRNLHRCWLAVCFLFN